jgi:hypothetical protein
VKIIKEVFKPKLFKKPTQVDLEKQLRMNANRSWLGMFTSLDCMHYRWKICPIAWQGSFTNKDRKNSIIFEAIANQRLWIWHACFELLRGNNDLNILYRSPLTWDFLGGVSVDLNFEVNGNRHSHYYLLIDKIYLRRSCFISTIHELQGEKHKHFA